MGVSNYLLKSVNSIVNQSDNGGAPGRVFAAIETAAAKTGVSFSYLMQKASQESSFDPTAKAATSSATGLFQFTSQTWLHMVKTYGTQYGLGQYANQISADPNGYLRISDPVARQAVLALRKDPQISAEMAGELDKENAASLKQNVGGKIGGTELYLAHFLGAGGASDFISQMRSNPLTPAADILPSAASANPSVFYDKSGAPRSLQQVYQHFAEKFGDSATQIASAGEKYLPSTSQITINIARMIPKANGATNMGTGTMGKGRVGTGDVTLASAAGSSTLFSTMLLGQVQDSGLSSPSPLAAFNGQSDARKKELYQTMYAIG